ncbi:MAG TPA: hypothetical protein VF721_19990, partial [Pyrinomonadaceae bacterium]
MKTTIRHIVTAIIAVTSFVAVTRAQVASNPPYTLEQSVVASGGGTGTGGVYQIEGTIGQAVAGTTSANGSFTL